MVSKGSQYMLNEMFNRVSYALSTFEFGLAIEELKKFKYEIAVWVEGNKLEQWGAIEVH